MESYFCNKKPLRLLVVDDQAAYCELIREYVELCSHQYRIECEVAQSGQEAMEKLGSFEPGVILLNAHIPDINSFELVQKCRSRLAHVIVTSEEPSLDIEESAMSWGASGYMTKTEDPDDVECFLAEIAQLADQIVESTH